MRRNYVNIEQIRVSKDDRKYFDKIFFVHIPLWHFYKDLRVILKHEENSRLTVQLYFIET